MLIDTTNLIEGLNRAIRKVIKTRALFPAEAAAKKLTFLPIRNDVADWKRPAVHWSNAMSQFAVISAERFTGAVMLAMRKKTFACEDLGSQTQPQPF